MGKAALLYVIGLTLLVSYILFNVNGSASRTVSNSIDYYERTVAHNIAVTAANVGTNMLLFSTLTSPSTVTGSFQGGTYTIHVDSVNAQGDQRLTAISQYPSTDRFGAPSTISDSVVAKFRHTPFARYGYFSGEEVNGYMSPGSNTTSGGSMWKVTGDSVFGPAHTNGQWHLGGRPYFDDKITGFNVPQTMVYGGVDDPIFNGGSEWGVTINRPQSNLSKLENIASSSSPSALFTGQDVALTFFPNGKVNVRIPAGTGATRNDTVAISNVTSSGVIAIKNGDVRVQGTYSGQVTVVALKGTASDKKGNIWIDGDLVAHENPQSNPASHDMMGLVAERMAYITTTGKGLTASSVRNVQAAIYTHLGVLAVENYDTVPVSGRLNLFGALSMGASTSTGKISGSSLTNGMLKTIRHDPRFLGSAPPSFPVSDSFQLIAWWEQ
jgi:hypothetical protein